MYSGAMPVTTVNTNRNTAERIFISFADMADISGERCRTKPCSVNTHLSQDGDHASAGAMVVMINEAQAMKAEIGIKEPVRNESRLGVIVVKSKHPICDQLLGIRPP